MDLQPQRTASGALLIHYGSPAVTAKNTVIVPVKTGATDSFSFNAFVGGTGTPLWNMASDYTLPPHRWTPSVGMAVTRSNRLYVPGSGGKLLMRSDADATGATVQNVVFYGASQYAAAPAAFDGSVFISTPLTADNSGNIFFGFTVTGTNPANLLSGLARVTPDGTGTWVGAKAASGDTTIDKVATNCAPALSLDFKTVYVAVNTPVVTGTTQTGYLLALDSTTLATKAAVRLMDPNLGLPARISDDGTSSPSVGPDGDVYYGVLDAVSQSHNSRGWLLHFNATLSQTKTPGSFGWDDTASMVPASMVPGYTGPSSYLLMTKYNNYAGAGTGDGKNRVAVLDPQQSQADTIVGLPVMKEIQTQLGQTVDPGYPMGVKEWCINTAAVDPFTKSILVNNEDGFLYRWDLTSNSFTQRVQLTSGVGEAYTPTIIGADGAVFAVNNAILFSVGR